MRNRCASSACIILAMIVSACRGDVTRSPKPTTPAPVPAPTPAPTPTPTPTPTPAPTPTLQLMDPANWEIGPIIPGYGNYSVGMPLHPSVHPEGWVIELPQPSRSEGHAHYVTTKFGPLLGKNRIVLRFRIEADPGVKIVPKDFPESPAMLTVYFQRAGDNWSSAGQYETYRWWASFRRQMPLTPGSYEIIVRFDENWTAILTSTAFTNWPAYQAALANADRVGFTLGGGDGAGHGVYATGPARIVVTSFQVE